MLLVFLMHATGQLRRMEVPFALTVSPLVAFIRDARAGVDVFFVLSGFLMSLPFVQALRGGRPVVLRNYFTRRALRILPLYATIVVVATLATSNRAADLVRGLPYLVFANSVTWVAPILPWSAVWWSLGTEMQFYLVLPLVALLVGYRRWLGVVLFVAWAAAYAGYVSGAIAVQGVFAQTVVHGTVLCRAPLFLGGLVSAIVYDRFGDRLRRALARPAWLRNGGADLLLLGVLAGLGFFFQWCVALGPIANTPRYQYRDIVDGAVIALLLLLILLAPLRLKPLVSNPVLARLGVLSYSVYLLHLPVLIFGLRAIRNALPKAELYFWSPRTAAAIVFLGLVCVALAELTFRFVEQPFLRRKARFDTRAPA